MAGTFNVTGRMGERTGCGALDGRVISHADSASTDQPRSDGHGSVWHAIPLILTGLVEYCANLRTSTIRQISGHRILSPTQALRVMCHRETDRDTDGHELTGFATKVGQKWVWHLLTGSAICTNINPAGGEGFGYFS